MDPTAQAEKYWLFDIDNEDDANLAEKELGVVLNGQQAYFYKTKNGLHIMVSPFDRMSVSQPLRKLIMMNPMILWAY
jgi:hypothetical protein